MHEGNGSSDLPSAIDVVLVHAGSSHILETWLDALTDGGRLLVPLTIEMPGLSSRLGKGVVLIVRRDPTEWRARFASPFVSYSLQGVRDETKSAALAKAMMAGTFARVTRLRRDEHEPVPTCRLHGTTNCLSG